MYDWNCLSEGVLDEACAKFMSIFFFFFFFFYPVKLCIPSKNVVVGPNDKPWYDHEIRHFSSKRD